MNAPQDTVFLFDVDNTLLDNDGITADLRAHLEREFGAVCASHYWIHFEALRSELGYADYLGALQRHRLDTAHGHDDDPRFLQMSSFLIDYPFASRLYPQALDVIARLNAFGLTVILSDGVASMTPRRSFSSHGQRSASVRGIFADIFALFSGGCRSSASTKAAPSLSASR